MRGKTASTLNLSERRERAFDLFRKGYTNADVARKVRVTSDTAAAYRKRFEELIQKQVADRPDLLSDVLGNTWRVVEETDMVRADAWRRLGKKRVHYCEECGEPCGCEQDPPHSAISAYHSTLLKAQDIRMKVFGLLGVKQEYFIRVQEIEALQRKLLEFMSSSLCAADRDRLEAFLGSQLPELMAKNTLPIIDVEPIEDYVTSEN